MSGDPILSRAGKGVKCPGFVRVWRGGGGGGGYVDKYITARDSQSTSALNKNKFQVSKIAQ